MQHGSGQAKAHAKIRGGGFIVPDVGCADVADVHSNARFRFGTETVVCAVDRKVWVLADCYA